MRMPFDFTSRRSPTRRPLRSTAIAATRRPRRPAAISGGGCSASSHPGGINAVLGDGSVRFLKFSIDPGSMRKLSVIDDGEVLAPTLLNEASLSIDPPHPDPVRNPVMRRSLLIFTLLGASALTLALTTAGCGGPEAPITDPQDPALDGGATGIDSEERSRGRTRRRGPFLESQSEVRRAHQLQCPTELNATDVTASGFQGTWERAALRAATLCESVRNRCGRGGGIAKLELSGARVNWLRLHHSASLAHSPGNGEPRAPLSRWETSGHSTACTPESP